MSFRYRSRKLYNFIGFSRWIRVSLVVCCIRRVVKGSLAPSFYCCLNRLLYNYLIEGHVILYIDFLLSQWTVSSPNSIHLVNRDDKRTKCQRRQKKHRTDSRKDHSIFYVLQIICQMTYSCLTYPYTEDDNDDIEYIVDIVLRENKENGVNRRRQNKIYLMRHYSFKHIKKKRETYLYVMCALHLKCHSFCRKCQAYTF